MPGLVFEGVYAEILADMTAEIAIIGGRNSGKTTVCLWKELGAAERWAGIWSYIFRLSDSDTKTKVRPDLERLMAIKGFIGKWNSTELCYEFENGSKIFCYGLKSIDLVSRYSKMRGMAVSRVLCSQAEEMVQDMADELRLVQRPNPVQVAKGQDFPRQLTFEGQPVQTRHWLATQFPSAQTIPRRKYYRLTLYDNKHLPAEVIAQAEATFPPDHPRYPSMILGLHGPNIIGKAVYEGLFRRVIHLKQIDTREGQLVEAFFTGKTNPVWVSAQRTRTGSLQFLGGIIGAEMFLTDFLPIVMQYRREWFGELPAILSCAAPVGAQDDPERFGDIDILRDHGFKIRFCENSNAPDVRLSMIEQIGDLMRHRTTTGEEAFTVNSDPERWLEASREGIKACPFLADGFEVGYVKDEHFGSVSHKEVRQPKADDWFEGGMRAAEYLVQNFCAGKPTQAAKDAKKAALRAARANEPWEASKGSMDWAK